MLKILSRLFQNAKIQDLNVIHNSCIFFKIAFNVVSECKDTRFECNSQPLTAKRNIFLMLFQNAKIQDLNVIHNPTIPPLSNFSVVSECKDTRFECNSQQRIGKWYGGVGCFRMQRYKI